MRAWSFLFALSVGVQFPAATLGAPATTPLDLDYRAPEPCPPAAALIASVTHLVGANEHAAHSLKASVTVEQDSRGEFRLTLVADLDGTVGERELHGRSCSSVVDAAAVTLALILNPDIETTLEPESPQGSDEVARKPISSDVPAKAQPVSAPPPRQETKREPIRWLGTSALGLHFGVMPNPGPEVTLGIGIGYGHWSVLGSGSLAPPQDAHVAGSPSAGARIWHAGVTALGCWSPFPATPRVGACLGAAVTRMQGHGVNVTYVKEGATTWMSPAAGVFADWRVTARTAFRFSGLVLHPLNRPDAHLDNLGTVQRPSILTADLLAGVIVQVP